MRPERGPTLFQRTSLNLLSSDQGHILNAFSIAEDCINVPRITVEELLPHLRGPLTRVAVADNLDARVVLLDGSPR